LGHCLPLGPLDAVATTVGIWNDQCSPLWQGETAAAWFSHLLGAEATLVYLPESTWRPAEQAYALGDKCG
jgi:hypothetical protein